MSTMFYACWSFYTLLGHILVPFCYPTIFLSPSWSWMLSNPLAWPPIPTSTVLLCVTLWLALFICYCFHPSLSVLSFDQAVLCMLVTRPLLGHILVPSVTPPLSFLSSWPWMLWHPLVWPPISPSTAIMCSSDPTYVVGSLGLLDVSFLCYLFLSPIPLLIVVSFYSLFLISILLFIYVAVYYSFFSYYLCLLLLFVYYSFSLSLMFYSAAVYYSLLDPSIYFIICSSLSSKRMLWFSE